MNDLTLTSLISHQNLKIILKENNDIPYLNIPFKTTTSLVEVLKLLHNEKEFSRNIIDSYQIACDEMIKNMRAFLGIIINNTYYYERNT